MLDIDRACIENKMKFNDKLYRIYNYFSYE